MATPTILIVSSIPSPLVWSPSPSVHVTPKSPSTLLRPPSWSMGRGRASPDVLPVVTKTRLKPPIPDADTQSSATDKGSPFQSVNTV